MISQLAALQNPEYLTWKEDKERFERINDFLREVVDRRDAKIQIPNGRKYVAVEMDDRLLPLESLGTGIEQVIMLAAFCTLAEKSVICIEEPEIHLHPLLQRKLISYLQKSTDNQYFIATHSASFIDTPGAMIFHVSQDNGKTRIRRAALRSERFSICQDLGHRASDIVQSNAVIWVEGPSDRVYLKFWLKSVAPDLIEGTHFSIMFYGGRLLSHLSANDEDVSKFIQLRDLNRNSAILIDSDRSNAKAPLNATKSRIESEFKADGIAWITAGREIENYVPHAVLQSAVRQVYGDRYGSPSKGRQFDHALYFNRSEVPAKLEKNVDKMKVSRAVAAGTPDLSLLDLKERVEQLATFIRRSNH